jgi:hypothetical protein
MNYFKRLETIFIIIIILVLGVAYGFLNSKPYPQVSDDKQAQIADNEVVLVPAGQVSYKGEDGKSAMELLKANFTVETQDFGDLGQFVKAINGVEPDSRHFWALYVNGAQSQVGAESYITKSSDAIEWKLEEIK